MSFRCEFCGKAQPSKTKGKRIVTKFKVLDGIPVIISPTICDFKVTQISVVQEKLACPGCSQTPVAPIRVN